MRGVDGEGDLGAAAGEVFGVGGASVGVGDRVDDCESEAGSVVVVRVVEGLECVVECAWGESVSGVLDCDGEGVGAGGCRSDGDVSATGCVAECIFEEVVDGLAQAGWIDLDDGVVGMCVDPHVVFRGAGGEGRCACVDEVGEWG